LKYRNNDDGGDQKHQNIGEECMVFLRWSQKIGQGVKVYSTG